ncbi:uncharacterized protein LOC133862449 [Alnus glutinosa]|uniref:uncharacterized protein LOC133862449 n=1 Tax=Alnus glutinosa TaxID=3517 RepID=UPI002D7727A9|nr:uncharacterized protein LOC133862449 [Alnus glutinosa]
MRKEEKKGSKAVMEAEKRRLLRDREPLSDSTNLTTTAANLSSIFTKSLPRTNSSANLNDVNDFRNPSSACTPSRPVKASSAHGTGDREVPEPCSVYSRRKTSHKQKGREKSIAVPLSCPPAVKTRNIWNMDKDGEEGQSQACTVPPKKKQRLLDVSDHGLPQDFIKQQKEYFAEIDAFKLEEEEVESSEQLE